MSLNEITNKVNELASSWEQFKVMNDQRLSEIEKKGSANPITLSQLEKLNNALDDHNEKINKLEASLFRPSSEIKTEVSDESYEHKRAFIDYLRKGTTSTLQEMEKKALSATNDAEGGYLVTHYISDIIAKAIFECSPLRKLASITTISTDALELIEDYDEAFAGWVQETETRADTKTPQVGKKVIQVHELYAQPKASQKLIDDARIDIEGWLAAKLSDIFSRMENAAFINGDGKGKPRGILSYPEGKKWGEIEAIKSQDDTNITADSIINLYFALKEVYAVKAKFLMNRATVQAIRMLKDGTSGKYLWQPGLVAGTPNTLLGAEILECPDMTGLTKNSYVIAFGDFKTAYQIVDRYGIRTLRDPYTDKPFVKFYTTRRVGGDVINFEAFKLLKLSA